MDEGLDGALGPDIKLIAAKRARENFPVASRFLPKAMRRHLLAIYGFARLTDDIGDEAAGDRSLLLDQVEEELKNAFSGAATHPIFMRLSETIATCRLDKGPFIDLIQANRRDQVITRYRTFDDLKGYCRLSAVPVGRLVLAVAGSLTPARMHWSDDVCSGLQIVEHLQDVGEDAARGRVYLPGVDLEAYGVSENDLRSSTAGPQFARLMAFEVERARGLLAAAQPLVGSLRGRLRVAVIGFAAGGFAALDAIEASGHDVLRQPIRGTKRRLLLHSARLFLGARGARVKAAQSKSPQPS